MSRNWKEAYDGKPVDEIFIGVGQEGSSIKNTAERQNGKALIFEYTYHGEYDEAWIVGLSQEGKELRRFSTKFITEIKWLL